MSGMDSSQLVTDEISLHAEKYKAAAHQHGDPEQLAEENETPAPAAAEQSGAEADPPA
ncbi:hypothetical protein [uncultured Modestobacter sp.]|uniref:hypothetical protein n=1 Tax=uncultured Modestobacter sp. TaxID=380048 RepID=UPI002637A81A|nr:hypothetical protein [uncultured Modestobacter sp.]